MILSVDMKVTGSVSAVFKVLASTNYYYFFIIIKSLIHLQFLLKAFYRSNKDGLRACHASYNKSHSLTPFINECILLLMGKKKTSGPFFRSGP